MVIPASGQTGAVYYLAVSSGSCAVPTGSVTQLISSVLSTQKLSTHVDVGTPGLAAKSES